MSSSNYILTSDGNFVSEDELYHYGVVGMKWGKRKAEYYTGKSNAHISKMNSSKTRLGKDYHNYMAYSNAIKAGAKKATDNVLKKTNLKNIDNVYGHGALERANKAASDYYNRKSTYTKTRLGTVSAKASAFNAKSAANVSAKLHNSKSVKEYAKNMVDAAMNQPIQTWSGRTTTRGKNVIDSMLGIDVIKDISYYKKTKN